MKRALHAVVLLVACGACSRSGGGPSFDVIVHVEGAPSGSDEGLDRDVLQPLERAVAASGLPMTTRGRVESGRGTIVVTPVAADADVGKVTAEVQRLLGGIDRKLLLAGEEPAFDVRTLPEQDALFVFDAPGYLPQSVDALAQVPGVRALDSCGLRPDTALVFARPDKLAAMGITLAELADAARGSGSDITELKRHPVGTRGARIDDVALVQGYGETTCGAIWGASGPTAVLEVRGFGVDRAKLTEVAANGKYGDPWEVAHVPPEQRGEVYVSRVRFEAPGPAAHEAAERLVASLAASRDVAWAIGEDEPAAARVRVVVGMRSGAPATSAAEAVVRAATMPRMRTAVDQLGGAIEYEAVLGSDETARTLVAALRKGGADVGCEGCSEVWRQETHYVVDAKLAADLGVAPAESARVVAALEPGGLELAGGRHLALFVPSGPDLQAIYVRGKDSLLVPFSAIAHAEQTFAYPRLSANGVPVVLVWIRAAPHAEALTAFAAAVPAGTYIRRRPPADQ